MKVLVIGAGRCGTAIAELLAAAGEYRVSLADSDERARTDGAAAGVPFLHLDASRREALDRALSGFDAVVAATPSWVCPIVAEAARAHGLAYLDLVDLPAVAETGRTAAGAFVPACGVSPGLVNNIAAGLVAGMGGPFDITVRVGALPLHPTNRLGYGLTWNIDDLIEEYTSDGAAIRGGRAVRVPPLQEHERLVLDGGPYEAFTTGAAAANLVSVLEGRAASFTLKTIRYAGHLDLMRFLMEDLGLGARRDHLKSVLQNGLPEVTQDVLLLFMTVRSRETGRLREISDFRRVVSARSPAGRSVGALQRTSAAHVAAMLDLLRAGAIPGRGLVGHEAVPTELVLGNRFMADLGL